MTTSKRPIFIEPKLKQIIELNMNMKSFSTRNDALVDMLKESKRYNELVGMFNLFNTQQSQELNNVKSSSCEMEKSELGSKETGELINGGMEDPQPNSSFSPADIKKDREIYWKGYEDGKASSLKHNIILMKNQLKSQKEFKK